MQKTDLNSRLKRLAKKYPGTVIRLFEDCVEIEAFIDSDNQCELVTVSASTPLKAVIALEKKLKKGER